MHNSSPEEKLLRLIKDATAKKEKAKEPPVSYQKPPELIKQESVFKGRRQSEYSSRIKRISKILNLESINLILRAGLVLIVFVFIFDIFWSNINIKKILLSADKTSEEINSNPFPEKQSGDFSHFSADINNRDIFTVSSKSTLDSYAVNSGSSIAQSANKLKLLGTISGEKQQAIIEDQDEQKSYTVSAGDYLKDFLVEEVGSGKVRLDYKGEKFDLFL